MINKILHKVVNISAEINYFIISLKLQAKNLFRDKSSKVELEILYEKYIKKARDKEIFPQREYNSNQIFIDYRNSVNGKLNESDEKYLIKALRGKSSRWFVPHVLNVIDFFSKKLMIQLIETAIEIKDPSYNNSFLTPAVRVYDLDVNDYLIRRFPNSTNEDKKGILRTFYWVQSRLSITFYPDGTEIKNYWVDYIWTNTKYKYIKYKNPEKYHNYKKKVIQKKNERTELLLDEYFLSTKKEMKDIISWYLPKEIDSYPINLLEKASKYLEEKNESCA